MRSSNISFRDLYDVGSCRLKIDYSSPHIGAIDEILDITLLYSRILFRDAFGSAEQL